MIKIINENIYFLYLNISICILLHLIWILPELGGPRKILIIIGSAIGAVVLFKNRSNLINKNAIPFWVCMLLVMWACIHLVLFSNKFLNQYIEFKKIWLYVILIAVFGMGLGIQIARLAEEKILIIIFLILFAPVLIYVVKYLYTFSNIKNLEIFEFMTLTNQTNSKYYIPKSLYVTFSIPLIGYCLANIEYQVKYEKKRMISSVLACMIAISSAILLYIEQEIKNGFIYTFILIVILIFKIPNKIKKISIILAFGLILFLYNNQNYIAHIKNVAEDISVSMDVENNKNWLYSESAIYPKNKYGKTVSNTIYERISWGIVGLKLIKENIIGYGLLQNSFKYILEKKYNIKNNNINHSHSGWIDFTLGLGVIGLILVIIMNSYLLILNESGIKVIELTVFWIILSLNLLWFTTEIMPEISLVHYMFYICLCNGIIIGTKMKLFLISSK